MKKSLLYLLLFLLIQATVAVGAAVLMELFSSDAKPTDAGAMMVISSIANVLTIALILTFRQYSMRGDVCFMQSRPWPVLGWTLLLGLAMLLPLIRLEELQPDWMQTNLLADLMEDLLRSPCGFMGIALLAPLAEEVVFRGAAITALREWAMARDYRHADRIAIVVSAVLFATAHLNPAQMGHAILVGVLLGWVCVRTGSILPCLLIHVINNASAFAVVWLFPELPVDARLVELFGGNHAAMYVAIALSLGAAVLAIRQLRQIENIN